jgi:hypothetical protein
VEEAKALLGSIFSDKKLSKQLIQVCPAPSSRLATKPNTTTSHAPHPPKFANPDWLVSARIQVWRVDLDGPGKFEAYRRKYLLLFNELLRDTRDVDRLELLVLKLFKDPILSQQRDVLVASCSSLVQVRLLSPSPGPARGQ